MKRALGKLTTPTDLQAGIIRQGLSALPITLHRTKVAGALAPHHTDPFDQMLIAQAQSQALTLVRKSSLITPIPAARKAARQDSRRDHLRRRRTAVSTDDQQYDLTVLIDSLRREIAAWLALPERWMPRDAGDGRVW